MSRQWSENVELKAKLADLEAANATAAKLGAADQGVLHQIDTYFRSDSGRLKLRVIDGRRGELIWYARPDQADSKLSRYHITPVADPSGLIQCLEAAWGVETVVEKRRRLWLYENVRIHLDRVAGLGDYLEFEAVLSESDSAEAGRRQLRFLSEQFHLGPDDLLTGSYREMKLTRSQA